MTKKSLLLTGIALIAGSAIIASQVSAYQGNPSVKGPNYTPERHELMQKAFDNNDYYAWKKLMAGRGNRVLQVINERNFSLFAKAHHLAALHNGSGSNQGGGMGRNR